MIAYDSLMIHYGELSTKGDNKRAFIRQLLHNIKDALNNDQLGYRSNRDHIVIALNGEDPGADSPQTTRDRGDPADLARL
jgi:thiamine biosynthesis protein ThiI